MRRNLSFLRVTSLAIAPLLLGATALLAGPGITTAAARPDGAQLAGIIFRGSRPGLSGSPATVTGPGSLSGVAALSATYAWAVGSVQVGSTLRTLIAHWNGRQ
jgi:hypothetical protein